MVSAGIYVDAYMVKTNIVAILSCMVSAGIYVGAYMVKTIVIGKKILWPFSVAWLVLVSM